VARACSISVCVLGSLSLLLCCGCGDRRFRGGPHELLRKRPASVNLERVADWSLLIDGLEFEGRHHALHGGQSVHFTGHLNAVEDEVPQGMVDRSLLIALRPAGSSSTGRDWDNPTVQEMWQEWSLGILGKDRRVDSTKVVKEDTFGPGEYHARIYFVIHDSEAGRNSVDLLGTATVTIVSPENGSSRGSMEDL
jgi:hypothetical protein